MEKIQLKEIITPGSVIRTKHPNSQWVSNVVHNVYDDYIQVELKEEYITSMIFAGDEIKVKYLFSQAEYLLEGEIENIDISNSNPVTIHVYKINMFKNIRANNRYDTNMISKVSLISSSPVYCIVTNISPSGISLLSKSEFPLDAEAYIEVFVNTDNIISFNGKIMRKTASEKGFEHGLKISEIDQENLEIFNRVLENLNNMDIDLLNKYLTKKS